MARQKILNQWLIADYAVCIYEAPHRIIECMEDIVSCLGDSRQIIMGSELTKQFETIISANASDLFRFIQADSNQQRGEFVLIIAPIKIVSNEETLSIEQINTLNLLLTELPPKKAVNLTHKLCGGSKDLLYNYAVNK